MRTLALFLLGLLLGGYCAIVSAQRLVLAGTSIPTGLILCLAVLFPIARAGAWWLSSRLGAVAIGVGWLIATLALGTQGPWGDYILGSGVIALVYIAAGSMLLAVAATLPLAAPANRPRRERSDA